MPTSSNSALNLPVYRRHQHCLGHSHSYTQHQQTQPSKPVQINYLQRCLLNTRRRYAYRKIMKGTTNCQIYVGVQTRPATMFQNKVKHQIAHNLNWVLTTGAARTHTARGVQLSIARLSHREGMYTSTEIIWPSLEYTGQTCDIRTAVDQNKTRYPDA